MKPTSKHRVRSVVMILASIIMLLPFYYIVVSTLKTTQEVSQHPLALPTHLYLDNYVRVFQENNILQSFLNTVYVTAGGVFFTVVIGALAAFPLVYSNTKGNKFMSLFLLGGFMVPVQASLIPLYLLMAKLRMIDTLTGLIILALPGAIFCSFMIQGYMRSIPIALFESAYLEGANLWQIFWKIIFPLLRPILVTTATFQTMGIWNDFMTPNIFINSPGKRTLVLTVYSALSEYSVDWPSFMTLSVIVIIPMVIFFLFAQKYLVKGLTMGSVK